MNTTENNNILPREGFARLSNVIRILGIKKTTLWNWVKTGYFPKPVKLGPRTTAWRVGDVRDFIAKFTETEVKEAKRENRHV
jgi:predicted DNA-binding transcriptional regulator AlpA